jgi:hypothetical protein
MLITIIPLQQAINPNDKVIKVTGFACLPAGR